MSLNEKWKISPLKVLNAGPIIPVIVIHKIEHAVPLAGALLAGGIEVLEITLISSGRQYKSLERKRLDSEAVAGLQ